MQGERRIWSLLEAMERIDRGAQPPMVSGPAGSFLRSYAAERNDVVRLALRFPVEIRADGALSGEPLGVVRLIPLFPDETLWTGDSPWGRRTLLLALCPELSLPVVLRLWRSATSAREAFREAIRGPDRALEVHGDFRWLPPGVITAGRAEYVGRERSSDEAWTKAPYVKAVAEEVAASPHALEYLRLRFAGMLALLHVRSFVVANHEDGERWVVGGARAVSYKLPAGPLGVPSSSHLARLEMCLGIRTPDREGWSIWKTTPCSAGEALEHVMTWAGFRTWLAGDSFDSLGAERAARAALRTHGIEAESTGRSVATPPPPVSALSRFARALVARMRLDIKPAD